MIRALVVFPLLMCLATSARSQRADIQPYIGASYSFAGITQPGVGAEIGVRAWFLYAGFETGLYGQPNDLSDTKRFSPSVGAGGDPIMTSIPSGLAEIYYAVDIGVVFETSIFVGCTSIFSHTDLVDGTHYWFNIGPDLRYEAWHHALFSGSYTYRRGVKVGLGFVL